MQQRSRKAKLIDYIDKYGHLPSSTNELINHIRSEYVIDEDFVEAYSKLHKKELKKNKQIRIVLDEIPEGYHRNRHVVRYGSDRTPFVQIYSPGAKEDNTFGKQIILISDDVKEIIKTPSKILINVYLKIPKTFNGSKTLLAEMGDIRPTTTPDWDNMGKKYCDMFNGHLYLDDKFIMSGTVDKYYSIKPRVEIICSYTQFTYTKNEDKYLRSKGYENIKCLESEVNLWLKRERAKQRTNS